jgi:hypothetical protein
VNATVFEQEDPRSITIVMAGFALARRRRSAFALLRYGRFHSPLTGVELDLVHRPESPDQRLRLDGS